MSVGFGEDTWCLNSLSPGRTARGSTLVAQALFRRLITPRGTLRGGDEEEAYGLDLAGLVGSATDEQFLASIPGQVQAELRKDDRVAEVIADVASSTAGDGLIQLQIEITATLYDESEDFSFTLLATAVTVDFIGGVAS